MFFMFGITPKTKQHGFVMQHCEAHGGSAWQELVSYRSWFKLFFVLPLFPVGREHNVLTCSECGMAYELSPPEAQQLAMQARHDVDVEMRGGMFGTAGLFGQLFGGGQRGYDEQYDTRGYDDRTGEPYPAGDGQTGYQTQPQAAADGRPMRIPSRRLDRGQ